MAWHTVKAARSALWRSRCGQRGAAALVMGAALVVAACGATTTAGGQPTVTVKPTATATPVPCTTWRIIPGATGTQYRSSRASAVSALSPTAAWTAGGTFTGDGGPVASLIEQWDGTAWRLVANPGVEFLSGVAAVSSNDAWAVGGALNYGVGNHPYMPLIVHWNGTQWAVASTSGKGTANAVQLNAIAAVAANDVWAVGLQDVGAQHRMRPLIEHWNGTAWQLVSSPTLSGTRDSAFNALAVIPGAQRLWAVGYATSSSGPGYAQPLIEGWDGSNWQVVTSPTLPSGAVSGSFLGVAALSATDAWGVGEYTASNHTIRTLIVHWDGTAWQAVASPDMWGSLAGVAAAGPHDVRAVGYAASGTGSNQHALIERWDGTSWQTLTAAEPTGARHSGLTAITADSAGNFWAVGSTTNASGDSQALTERCP
jgi:hypothetical protein